MTTAPSNVPLLRLEHVSKVFKTGTLGGGDLPAVRDVSFTVDREEVIALVGESGSGKTTIGRMILRLSPVTRGTITFEGTDVETFRRSGLKSYYRHIQGVFQDPFSSYNPIFKADRVFTTIHKEYFPDVSERQWAERIESSLADVSLNPGDVLHKFPHQLSGGQLQRLLIARALLLDLRLLVADEVISMLDASTRIDVLNLLGELKARGLGIIFITHDLSLGNYISDKTIILHRGAIVEMGVTELVFNNPIHSYTKTLLASVPRLHERWADRNLTPGRNGTNELPDAPALEAAPPSARRHSTSALHPTAGAPVGLHGRPRSRPPTRATLLNAALESAPLTEVEHGHFVAIGDSPAANPLLRR